MAIVQQITGESTQPRGNGQGEAEDQTSLAPLCRGICRRDSHTKLTSLLIEVKDSTNTRFSGLVGTLRDLSGKIEARGGMTRMLDALSETWPQYCADFAFMYLIEAIFAAYEANGCPENYGSCLKVLDKRFSDFKFHDAEHIRFWLARHKTIHYMSRYKPVCSPQIKACKENLMEFYKSCGNKPDMWKAFACQQLYQLRLYEEYCNDRTIKTSGHESEEENYEAGLSPSSESSMDALSLLDYECNFAAWDPEHDAFPGNYDFLWPHVQRCFVKLRIPIGFHMHMWTKRFPNASRMRYTDLPEHFTSYFETPVSSDQIDECKEHHEKLKQMALHTHLEYDVDEDYLHRVMSVIEIGILVRLFSIGKPDLYSILDKMISFMDKFIVIKSFYLRDYTYARPESIFPVFLCFLKTVLRDIEKVSTGSSIKSAFSVALKIPVNEGSMSHYLRLIDLVADSCEMQFSKENLFKFRDELQSFLKETGANMCCSASHFDQMSEDLSFGTSESQESECML